MATSFMIQRKRRILKQRLKVPPTLNQFTKTLDKNLVLYCMYLYIDMKVEHFILVLAQSELMSDHEHDDSDTEFIDIDIAGSYGWVLYLSLHRHEGGKFTA
ncbi:putative ribosomal protein L7A/L8 superfamily [Helianthus annuus]|uniref:Ribosomal protein L7A/L8 superfamily n=1 Tax=Helianthus annuus TaxID=4232 RepID=A0A251UC08_HELAN|nr:putative ribosomal protein L7A/L8 superfamily [Helianthus annuus]KAJ0465159.1 putative 50S ribosomal protein L30e [Helianthus annuus]KAJ0468452.1 putative ribosomal protein L7A/L8 superfamily [Helianthus annuus]KAJ0469897.1 putative ribosomal protein L7A/L8 superfamily [Helianthus annuus]KAJ0486752.1 putative 50S ribosomal protein L30e [Helianthus annuus]